MAHKLSLIICPDDFPTDWSLQKGILYSIILQNNNEFSEGCVAAIKSMARILRCSEDTVRRLLKELESSGYITIIHRQGDTNLIKIPNQLDNSKEISQTQPEKKTRQEKNHAPFDCPDPNIKEYWDKWLAYKKERKEYYVPSGIVATWKKLIRLSGGDPNKAKLIIQQAIENGWMGFYELKPQKSTVVQNKMTFMRGDVPL